MPAKFIVIEGIDGSGKSTQCFRLCQRLSEENVVFKRLVFPQYQSNSSALIKMYLNGELSKKASDVNPYAASTFYAVDRYASFVSDWGEYYRKGGLLLSDRYTSSNAVHQGAKLPDYQLKEFFQWLYDFEHVKMELPEPDLVIYMDTSLEASLRQIASRELETGVHTDIHEKDKGYLSDCLRSAEAACKHFGWEKVQCLDAYGEFRNIEDIHDDIFELVKGVL